MADAQEPNIPQQPIPAVQQTLPPQPPAAPPVDQSSDDDNGFDMFTQAASQSSAAAPPAGQQNFQHPSQPNAPLPGATDPNGQPSPSTDQITSPAAAGNLRDDLAAAGQTTDPGALQQSVAAPAPPVNENAARLQALGIDPAQEDRHVSALLDRIRELTPYAQAGMQHLAQPPQQPAAPAAPAAPAEEEWNRDKYFAEKWNAPELKPEYERAVSMGAVEVDPNTGLYRPVAGYEAMVVPIINGINEYHQWHRQNTQELFNGNPYQKFHDVIAEPIKRDMRSEVEKLIDERMAQIDDQRFFEGFRETNSGWLYTKDGAGREVETPQGKHFIDTVEFFVKEQGKSPREAVQLAQRFVQTPQPNVAPAQQSIGSTGSAAAPVGSPNLASGAAQPSNPAPGQAPAAPAAPAAQQPIHPQQQAVLTPEQISAARQQSFLDSALDRAAHNASAVGGVPAQAPSDDGDIDSMFSIAAAATAGQTPT